MTIANVSTGQLSLISYLKRQIEKKKEKSSKKENCSWGRKQDTVIKVQGLWLPHAKEIWRQIMCRKQKKVPDSHTLLAVLKLGMESLLCYLFSSIGLLRKTECGNGVLAHSH